MKKVLSIAGSDPSGGAGIQADIKTITAHKLYAMAVIVSLTAQNTTAVSGVLDCLPEFVESQIDSVLSDITPDAIKLGMLSNANIMHSVAKMLKQYNCKNIVLDPVMVATTGGRLMDDNALGVYIDELFALARVVTPNLPEASVLSGIEIKNIDDMRAAAIKISSYGCQSVLIKGGHFVGNATDLLYKNGEFTEFSVIKIDTKNTHGTGCTLSSAIACNIASGLSVKDSVKNAKDYVTNALKNAIAIGHGNGPINHCWNL
ncbi:bifunctional hydroxymethylpyrimidine kinase/phosphomethylpyrimidine kinase [Campylobacter sp.]|uniref:bifunctional hydroxymethylpyrimidine kinase/phosphomethylpyrimidine kinase n=1 Tax=Campylobacter sp. TaxID=205 RepID=UPI00259CD0D5|nr:bifunctional hydroxymethylpyrimidine kinase/phosphomethylpyrimidine kinase [Campylobacter sp.]MBQ7135273.1 bifunctional hydroxymethylpyrimidine kinase/phosphomethylpyrimidine kinase [Campylobacter sp.]